MGEKFGLNSNRAYDTVLLECDRRGWNVMCSGEMHRYVTEHRSRSQVASSLLTLMHESVGIKQD